MVFKTVVSGDNFQNTKILQKSNLKLKLKIMVLLTSPAGLFSDLPCDFNDEMVIEDRHSHQLTKEIIGRFIKIRLLRYGQYFTEMTVKKGKSGIRQKLNKSRVYKKIRTVFLFLFLIRWTSSVFLNSYFYSHTYKL